MHRRFLVHQCFMQNLFFELVHSYLHAQRNLQVALRRQVILVEEGMLYPLLSLQ